MSKMGVPGFNETVNQVPQVLRGTDAGAAQAFAAQYREPDLHLIEPRAMRRQPVEGDFRALRGAPVQDGLFLVIARVVDNQVPATVGVTPPQGAQEVAELQIGMALIALRKDFSRQDIKGGKEIDRAMADILKLLAFDQARPQGQGRVQAFQGLDVGLLVQTQNPTAAGRMQIEVDNLGHLLRKPRVRAGQEVAHPMRFEDQFGQNPVDGCRAHGQNFSPAGDQLRQIAHAIMRKAPKLPFLSPLAGDGDDRVPGQRGKTPGDDPTGENRGARLSPPQDRVPLPSSAAGAHTTQSACAISGPDSVRSRSRPQSLDWTARRGPAREGVRAAPSVGVFSPPAAGLLRHAVRWDLTESHTGARAYAPLAGKHCPEYTANELARHGTSHCERRYPTVDSLVPDRKLSGLRPPLPQVVPIK